MNIDIHAAFLNGLLADAAHVNGLTTSATKLVLENLLRDRLT
ncbi:MAG: hypothetical protein JWQ07_5141 [Ramlibacter sp.]|nr:hypothetical protein [Ramlibacter sp.]